MSGSDRRESDDVHLTISNRRGSVEHYFHFLLGFFVPLVLAREALASSGGVRRIHVRSCAILDDLVRTAGYPEIVILDKREHEALRNVAAAADGTPLRCVTVAGYDYPDDYDAQAFAAAASCLQERLAEPLARCRAEILGRFRAGPPRIVLIDRDAPHPFYDSEHCEIKSAGRTRRSIANFVELREAVAASRPNVVVERLEGKSLPYQMALFGCADIVIAQHGAAIANLIWARRGAGLLEIVPEDMPHALRNDPFGKLAACLGQNCRQVLQPHCHGAVDVGAVLAALDDLLASAPRAQPENGKGRLVDRVIGLLRGRSA